MEFVTTTELSIPVYQMALLLGISTLALLFGRVKLALLVNYLFTMSWGYGLTLGHLAEHGYQNVGPFTLLYFGFGLVVAALAIVGFLAHNN
jgi:hypothetical protein